MNGLQYEWLASSSVLLRQFLFFQLRRQRFISIAPQDWDLKDYNIVSSLIFPPDGKTFS
jgi:hypothetical protein